MKQLTHTEIPITPSTFPIVVICDDVQLPANIGTIFRLADAFGVEKVIFGGENLNIPGRKVKHVSRSTHQWIQHSQTSDLVTEITKMKADGYCMIALEITDKSRSLNELELTNNQKIALVVGSEINGISQAILQLCNLAIHIPIYGKNSSMNVGNALAIMLYETTRQLSQANL